MREVAPCNGAQLAAVYSLRRNNRWPANEDPAPWLTSPFKVYYKSYADEHLAQVARQCPLRRPERRKRLFFQPEPDGQPGCDALCVLLQTERERESWTEAARILRTPAGGVHYYLEQCRKTATRLFFEASD